MWHKLSQGFGIWHQEAWWLGVSLNILSLGRKNKVQLLEVVLVKTKTIKTPLLMSEAFGPTSCFSGFIPESTLSHKPEVQYGLVPRLRHQGGSNSCIDRTGHDQLHGSRTDNAIDKYRHSKRGAYIFVFIDSLLLRTFRVWTIFSGRHCRAGVFSTDRR